MWLENFACSLLQCLPGCRPELAVFSWHDVSCVGVLASGALQGSNCWAGDSGGGGGVCVCVESHSELQRVVGSLPSASTETPFMTKWLREGLSIWYASSLHPLCVMLGWNVSWRVGEWSGGPPCPLSLKTTNLRFLIQSRWAKRHSGSICQGIRMKSFTLTLFVYLLFSCAKCFHALIFHDSCTCSRWHQHYCIHLNTIGLISTLTLN